MPTFSLDAIREETVKKYEPVKVTLSDETTVELKSILRLGQKAREEVLEVVKDINAIDTDDDDDDEVVNEYAELICESIARIFRLIASSPRKLIAGLEHEDKRIQADLYTAVLTNWLGETQLGEASNSPASSTSTASSSSQI